MPCQEDPRLVLKIGTNPSKPLHMALGVCQPPLVLDALLPPFAVPLSPMSSSYLACLAAARALPGTYQCRSIS